MTERQQIIFEFIINFISEKRYSPTIREIADAIGRSPSTVHGHLDNMRTKGIINFVDSSPRTLSIFECV